MIDPDDSAFPHEHIANGLTKREYFAALALQGFLRRETVAYPIDPTIEAAVGFADALIKELSK